MMDRASKVPALELEIERLIDALKDAQTDNLNLRRHRNELRKRVEALEVALMEIRQAAEDNNLMPDYIIALTMVASTEQEGVQKDLICFGAGVYRQLPDGSVEHVPLQDFWAATEPESSE